MIQNSGSSTDEDSDLELGDNARDFLLKPSHFTKNSTIYDGKMVQKMVQSDYGSYRMLILGNYHWIHRVVASKNKKFRILRNQQCVLPTSRKALQNEADIAYYFEEGIRHLSDNQTMTCFVLSRYRIFPNSTSILSHSDHFCFDDGDDFGSDEPTLIANDNNLISCFNLIRNENDFCIFAHFDDDTNGLKSNSENQHDFGCQQ